MISQKLLSEVLNIPLKDNPKYDEGLLFYRDEYDTRVWTELDIHRLQHLCKKWANDKKLIQIVSSFDGRVTMSIAGEGVMSVYEDTEVLSVFKACEWILKENK